MPVFVVSINETLSRTIDVEADTIAEAVELVQDQYDREQVVLDADDFVDVEINGEYEIKEDK